MEDIQTRLLLLLVLLVAAGPIRGFAQQAETPPIVRSGLDAYRTNGIKAALDVWLKDSPVMADATVPDRMRQGIAQIEAAYGRMVGYDVLRVVAWGPNVRRTYVVILYERAPAYAFFDAYQTAKGWVIPGFLTNTKPEAIFPASVLAP